MRPNFGPPSFRGLPRRLDATTALVIFLGIGAIVTLLFPGLAAGFVYDPATTLRRPWTPLTYPLVIPIAGGLGGPIFTALLLIWTYQLGRSLEPAMGRVRFVGLWLFGTLAPAALFAIPMVRASAAGPLMPVALLTVVWAARSPNAPVLLYFFPVAAKWVAALVALGVFATYYPAGLLVSLAALVPLGAGWAFAAGRIPGLRLERSTRSRPTKEQLRREAEFRDEVSKRRQERDERERLRRLLEGPAARDAEDR